MVVGVSRGVPGDYMVVALLPDRILAISWGAGSIGVAIAALQIDLIAVCKVVDGVRLASVHAATVSSRKVEGVVTSASIEVVDASTAVQFVNVFVAAAVQRVIPGFTIELVGTTLTKERVVA